MGKTNYTFIFKSGTIKKLRLSPKKAELFGDKKGVKVWGLSSMLVLPRKKRKK